MRPYLVLTYNYQHNSGGGKVMHRICHELNAAGCEAYSPFPVRNPDWLTPFHDPPLDGDWIALYPEIVPGNPWNAPHVARYILNGGTSMFAPDEEFYFHELFNDAGLPPERKLYLPTIELDFYYDQHLPRSGEVYWVGKGSKSRDMAYARQIDVPLTADRRALAEVLNRASVMYSFDPVTGMNDIARLCGCPVILIPSDRMSREDAARFIGNNGIGWDEQVPLDVDAYRADTIRTHEEFPAQLANFIRLTQA